MQRKTLSEATAAYTESLLSNEQALTYLEGRGLGDEEVIRDFQLGVVDEPAISEHAAYRGRLSIPYITPAGVVAIKFRCLREHDCKSVDCPKYLPGNEFLYNVAALHDAGTKLYVSEGELNAITSTMLGTLTGCGWWTGRGC
jgi:hypothetical protein